MTYYSVNVKKPDSPSLAYQSRFTTDEGKAALLFHQKLKLCAKGFDVWLEGDNKVIEGPGWRDLYSRDPRNEKGANPGGPGYAR